MIPTVEPLFPEWLDSTMLSTYKSCAHKFWLEYVLNYKPKEVSVHLHAGAAFASGLEAARMAFYRDGKSSADAEGIGLGALLTHYGDFECPADSAKSAERMAGALEFYLDNYPLGADGASPITLPGGRLGIEVSFAEPLPEVLHPVTGNPLLYCGRLDLACNYSGGVFVEDDKTTSSLGATWSKQWDLRSQFTGYCWGLREAARVTANGCLVRGVSILKTKYDTQQAITYRAPWQIDEWLAVTLSAVKRMIADWNSGEWRKSLDHACAEYGGCHLRNACLSNTPQNWLDTFYVRRLWNPVTRQETLL